MLSGKGGGAGFGDVGKGSAASHDGWCKSYSNWDWSYLCVTSCNGRLWSRTMEEASKRGDIFVTAIGKDVLTLDHMRNMKDRSIVCIIGHFD